ncbi:MAG TPA: alpha-glucosidase [Myxococcota bacterium]|nr:alpha-glucosidase [Myxococcota bacterium]HQK51174.1 alpha-glucosidase [Myxococcota bacterium]
MTWRSRSGMLVGLLWCLPGCGGTTTPGPGDLPEAPEGPSEAVPCDFDRMSAPWQPAESGSLPLADFRVVLGPQGDLEVFHVQDPGRSVFAWAGPEALRALRGRLEVEEIQGSFAPREGITETCRIAPPARVRLEGPNLVLEGGAGEAGAPCEGLRYEVRLCQPRPHHLVLEVRSSGTPFDAWEVRAMTDPEAPVFGLGEQFVHDTLDLRGRVIPILVREQGIGRGEPAISETMEALSPGSSGDESTTYHPMPHVVTADGRSWLLENEETSFFDLSSSGRIAVRTWAPEVRIRVFHGVTPLELVERLTEFTGRMREPPDWVDQGAVVALARDLPEGLDRLAFLQDQGVPIAAVWNQTWCGTARTVIGEQVLWNWALPPSRQAAWDAWVDVLQQAAIRPLCYVNPMFRDLPPEADPATRNLYREAVEAGHVVRTAAGEPYRLRQGVFEVVLLDLSSEAARAWMKAVLKDELLGRARCRGWMADFGEALPLDAVLASGEPAARWHNRYPVEWARLNREALEEAGVASEVLVFHRSGFMTTASFSGMQWEGDQTVTWDRFDGLRSALHGLLNGGFSGIALNHSDAGGYTGVPLVDPPVRRSPELLMRWVEMNAFTALLRTHEGNQPAQNAQVYQDGDLARHFGRFARIYRALAPYRRSLYREAADRGWPVVRHLAMHHPTVSRAWTVTDEFLLGADLLVAPVLEPGDETGTAWRRVWWPPGTWRHLWTGEVREGAEGFGSEGLVEAPLGRPPVFLRVGSALEASLPAALAAEGVTDD